MTSSLILVGAPQPSPTPTAEVDRRALLEHVAVVWGKATIARDGPTIYELYPQEYRSVCPYEDFLTALEFVWPLISFLDGATYVVDSVRIEGNHGWVANHWERGGTEFPGGSASGEPHYVWNGDHWEAWVRPEELSGEKPCKLEF